MSNAEKAYILDEKETDKLRGSNDSLVFTEVSVWIDNVYCESCGTEDHRGHNFSNCIMEMCTMSSLEYNALIHFNIWWDRFRKLSVMSHCVRIQTLRNGCNVDLGTEIPCSSRRTELGA